MTPKWLCEVSSAQRETETLRGVHHLCYIGNVWCFIKKPNGECQYNYKIVHSHSHSVRQTKQKNEEKRRKILIIDKKRRQSSSILETKKTQHSFRLRNMSCWLVSCGCLSHKHVEENIAHIAGVWRKSALSYRLPKYARRRRQTNCVGQDGCQKTQRNHLRMETNYPSNVREEQSRSVVRNKF